MTELFLHKFNITDNQVITWHWCTFGNQRIDEIKNSTNGHTRWSLGDLRHRNGDLPAVIYANGSQEWYKNGKLHRDGDQPAVIRSNGSQVWHKNGLIHREGDQPAYIGANGSQAWYKNGDYIASSLAEYHASTNSNGYKDD